ncbi:YcaO-like domain protein [Candidatus Magnetoovum chiemensis]|nr:YcaO-like domain protein [Candidatus Magnetoovum chiemensis]
MKYEGIKFRENLYSGPKTYKYGTHRAISPESTYQKIKPYFKKAGITRIANITGLDNIGIPTALSVRPNSIYLSVDAGKGFTLKAAEVSASMECIERYSAETAKLDEITLPYEKLSRLYETEPLDKLPLSKESLFNVNKAETWALGYDIISGKEVYVPSSLVHLRGFNGLGADRVSFQFGSNGLASGNTFAEALCMGVYEVIERDAITCHTFASQRINTIEPRVRLSSIDFPLVRELIERLRSAEAALILLDCSTDTQVPVYKAYVYDVKTRNVGVFKGYGAHLDREIAMVRAITEAVQARAVYIAGARDDFFKYNYVLLKTTDNAATIKALEEAPQSIDAALTSQSTDTFEGDIRVCIEKLKNIGLDSIIVFDLTPSDIDISVVRVVIPGLEGYMNNYYAPGKRALKRISQKG